MCPGNTEGLCTEHQRNASSHHTQPLVRLHMAAHAGNGIRWHGQEVAVGGLHSLEGVEYLSG